MAEEKKKPRGLAQALGFKNGRDMFDGGGKNATGPTFEGGGPLSALANAMNIAPAGYHARQAESPTRAAQMQDRSYRRPTRGTEDYRFFRDMFDGGGMGYEGNSFSGGGGYSVLANMLGIKPIGYEDRMEKARAFSGGTPARAPQPSQIASGTQTSAPKRNLSGTDFEPAPYQFDPVTTYPVSGPFPIGAMSTEELLRIANQGIYNSTRDRLGNGTFIR